MADVTSCEIQELVSLKNWFMLSVRIIIELWMHAGAAAECDSSVSSA